MNKDFDSWNDEKKRIDEREVWYTKLWINIGNEENGKREFRRPVMIIKRIWNMYLILPLTTKGKDTKFYYEFPALVANQKSWWILSQIKVIDKKRMIDKIDIITDFEFHKIKKHLKSLLGL